MISRFRVTRLFLDISHDKALALLKSVARTHGFEITEVLDLEAFVRRRTGARLNRKISLVQMQKPAMMLGSALVGDTLPLLLPLRIILLERAKEASVLHLPDWNVARDLNNTQAQHCMEIVYTETVGKIAESLRCAQKRHGGRDPKDALEAGGQRICKIDLHDSTEGEVWLSEARQR